LTIVRSLLSAGELCRARGLGPEALRHLQSAKLRRIVEHAFATVPFYRRLWTRYGLRPDHVQTVDDLHRLPVVDKSELQATPVPSRLSASFDRSSLLELRTSGSTGRPMTLFRDRDFASHQRLVFLRALLAAGLRPWHRLLLVTGENDSKRAGPPGWRYVSSEAPVETVLAAMRAHRPHMVYGFLTPLRHLAEAVRERGRPSPLRAVVSTAETLDNATRTMLEEAFGAEVFDIYGCTEVGPVAWECSAHDGYHLAAETTIVECLPQEAGELCAVVLTSLDLRAMPLIRYALGDLASLKVGPPCRCGCRLPRLDRIEGRIADCVRLRDGRVRSPYHLTLALEQVEGLVRYQVVQTDLERFLVRAQGGAEPQIGQRIAAALRREVGAAANIEVRWEANLEPPRGHKFRVVECRLPTGAVYAS